MNKQIRIRRKEFEKWLLRQQSPASGWEVLNTLVAMEKRYEES